MKKTQEKIIIATIELFNKTGVSNVRLQDIAKEVGISPGNLTYHYKTKKDLLAAVLSDMTEQQKKVRNTNLGYVASIDIISILTNYLSFQIQYRFFYRDILEIMKLVPAAKTLLDQHIQEVISFSKNAIQMSVARGYMKAEPHEGHYELFAKNAWAILHSWLREREVFGEEKVSLYHAILAVLELHYFYLTEEGLIRYAELKEQLPTLVKEKIITLQ